MPAAANPRGLKRICLGCGMRFYDMNKRPIICPGCKAEFMIETKTKGGRRARPANDDGGTVKAAEAEAPEKENVEEAAGDDMVVSLEEVEEDADDIDDDADLTIDDDIDDLDDDLDDEDEDDEEEDKE